MIDNDDFLPVQPVPLVNWAFIAGLGWGLFLGAAGWMVYFAWFLGGI